MKPIAIIGLGNYLMGDEGVGIHATKILRREAWPDDVEIIDAGVPSLALLHMMEGRKLIILIDCADFGAKPGTIKAFRPDDVKRAAPEKKASLHAADLMTTFDIAAQAGLPLPPVWIVGIQPACIEMTMELSPEASTAIAELRTTIDKILNDEGLRFLH
jgi:hydrogenase maturation protease